MQPKGSTINDLDLGDAEGILEKWNEFSRFKFSPFSQTAHSDHQQKFWLSWIRVYPNSGFGNGRLFSPKFLCVFGGYLHSVNSTFLVAQWINGLSLQEHALYTVGGVCKSHAIKLCELNFHPLLLKAVHWILARRLNLCLPWNLCPPHLPQPYP